MLIYHPDTDQLMEHAAGTLHPALHLCIAMHLEYCEQCRSQTKKMEYLGGALFDTLAPENVASGLLDSIWQRIDTGGNPTPRIATQEAPNYSDPVIPHRLLKKLDYSTGKLRWRRHGMKVRSAELLNHQGTKALLLDIRQGARIPEHDHHGDEYTVVLKGSFSDGKGLYHEGDLVMHKPGSSHSPTATLDKPCLCLVVLEAPLKFESIMYRFTNWLMPL